MSRLEIVLWGLVVLWVLQVVAVVCLAVLVAERSARAERERYERDYRRDRVLLERRKLQRAASVLADREDA